MLGRSPFNLSQRVIVRLIIWVLRGRQGKIEAPAVVGCRLERFKCGREEGGDEVEWSAEVD